MTTRHRTGAGARMNADNIWLHRLAVLLVVGGGVSGILMSWTAQLHVAEWTVVPSELSWTVPVMLDVPIATLALIAMAMKSRGNDPAARLLTVLSLIFTVLSGAVNFIYVADESGLRAWTDVVGASLKAVAPFITFGMTEVLGLLVFRPKRVRKVKRRSAKPVTRRPAAVAPVTSSERKAA